MTRFQLIFTGALVFLGVAGVMTFALVKKEGDKSAPMVVMWGTLDSSLVSNFVEAVSARDRERANVSYVKKSKETFEDELIAALARGSGPDMILLPQDLILKQLDKFFVTPFEDYSERTFKDSFIQQGELFLTKEGIVGFPFAVDPMVMYWNRDMLTSVDVANPPVSWTEFFGLVPKLTKKDERGNITQSLVAFGEMRNVTHAKDIVSLLALQAGTPIVDRDDFGNPVSVLDKAASGLKPAEVAVSFFTEFSNPVKDSYSWNRALVDDRSAFLSSKLALYFGYASELVSLRNLNPNLNFDVALVPQTANAISGNSRKMTFGNIYAIALLKSSRNLGAAYTAALALTDSTSQAEWVQTSGFPPVRRDLLVKLPGDAYKAVFYRSALISNAWLDPNREATNNIFMNLVESVTSGKQRVSQSVNTASIEIDKAISKNI